MTRYRRRRFFRLFDDGNGALFADIAFNACTFDWCRLSQTESVKLRSTVRNVRLTNCIATISVDIGPAVFEDVIVDELKTEGLLILWCPLFKHVTLKGKIGRIKVNSYVEPYHLPKVQRPFDEARARFYKNVDWALDISEAQFKELDLKGVPSRLVRRDPATQVVVTREKAMRRGWRKKLSADNEWADIIDLFLDTGEPDFILIAPKGARKPVFTRDLQGLDELRAAGVAEPD